MTQSISIYDCTLLSMKSMEGTSDYTWSEPKPCSDKVTRVLGRVFCLSCVIFNTVPLAVVMAEEGEEVLEKAILWLQKQQEKLRDGFSIQFQQEEYTFVVDYIDK